MRKWKKIIAVVGIIAAFGTTGCTASWERSVKSFSSNYGGGLNRTVTVYDYNGTEIKSWSGKFDVSDSENEVYFDVDGKRVIVHGGIVIDEENQDLEVIMKCPYCNYVPDCDEQICDGCEGYEDFLDDTDDLY